MDVNEGQEAVPDAESLTGPRWAGLLDTLTSCCGVLLYLLAFLVTVDVAHRWFMGRPIVGVFEISEVLLLGITFLAVAAVQASGKQLSVDILTSGVKGRKKRALRLLDAVAALLFFAVLLWTGIIDLMESVRMGLQGSGIMKIPTSIPLGLLVLGCVVMLATLVIGIWRDTKAIVAPGRTREKEAQ